MTAPRIRNRAGENTKRLIAFQSSAASEALRAAGACEVLVERTCGAGAHLMGTASYIIECRRAQIVAE